jgi:hypothetical protein
MNKKINNAYDIIRSQSFLINIVKKIETLVKHDLSDSEEDLVINCINKVPNHILNTSSLERIVNIITDTVISELHREHCMSNDIDTHEMLKKQIGKTIADPDDDYKDTTNNIEVNVETLFGIKDVSTLIKKINEPISSVNTAYFLLDTRYRVLENDGSTYFKWCHMNNITTAQGTFNSIGDIRDIISIKLMQYRIPKVPSAINPYNRISLLIHEFSAQSFMAHENVQYHFLGCTDDKHNSDWIEVKVNDFCHGEYKFNKPITTINTITISLGSPVAPIIFEPDRGVGIIEFTQLPLPAPPNPALTTITFPVGVNFKIGDIVYITNYTTINSEQYPCLIELNSPTGLPVITTTVNSITIAVDTSSLNKKLLTGTINLTFSSSSIQGVGTNFISELKIGDQIFINNINSTEPYIVKNIISNTLLNINKLYKLTTTTNKTVEKNNIITNDINVYFGSKRIFFTLEATYLSS